MKSFSAVTVVGVGLVQRAEVAPVQKVVQLMEGMLAKGKSEKQEEQVQFAAYKQFCDDITVEEKRATNVMRCRYQSLRKLMNANLIQFSLQTILGQLPNVFSKKKPMQERNSKPMHVVLRDTIQTN